MRRPTLVKAYVSVFISLSVKATHIKVVSDLTAECFLAALRRFIARRGKPQVLWSDHGTNFTGANRQLGELYEFLQSQQTQSIITKFRCDQNITWKFIVHSRTCTSFWWHLGSCSEIFQDSSLKGHGRCETYFRRTEHRTSTD